MLDKNSPNMPNEVSRELVISNTDQSEVERHDLMSTVHSALNNAENEFTSELNGNETKISIKGESKECFCKISPEVGITMTHSFYEKIINDSKIDTAALLQSMMKHAGIDPAELNQNIINTNSIEVFELGSKSLQLLSNRAKVFRIVTCPELIDEEKLNSLPNEQQLEEIERFLAVRLSALSDLSIVRQDAKPFNPNLFHVPSQDDLGKLSMGEAIEQAFKGLDNCTLGKVTQSIGQTTYSTSAYRTCHKLLVQLSKSDNEDICQQANNLLETINLFNPLDSKYEALLTLASTVSDASELHKALDDKTLVISPGSTSQDFVYRSALEQDNGKIQSTEIRLKDQLSNNSFE